MVLENKKFELAEVFVLVNIESHRPQGNRTSKQGQEFGKIGVIPRGSFELAPQRALGSIHLHDVQCHVAENGSGANFGLVAPSLCSNCFSCGEHSRPYGGCGFGLNLKFAEVKVVFANAVEKFEAGDGDFCSSEPLEAEHGTYPGFYRTILGIVPNLILLGQFSYGSMRCGIAIKRYDPRRTTLRLQGLPEEEFGCRYIATRTQSEINGPAFPPHL